MMYAIYLKTGKKEYQLVYQGKADEHGRIYWLGGSDCLPLIFLNRKKANNVMKKVQAEFRTKHRQSVYKPHRFRVALIDLIVF